MTWLTRFLAWLMAALALGMAGLVPAQAQRGPAPAAEEIEVAQLPAQARDTLSLIARGGPFPYEKDGTVFQNRERRLPAKPRGYYREYTVKTPGAKNRGARRIVAGADGDKWYTDDHYETFRRIRE